MASFDDRLKNVGSRRQRRAHTVKHVARYVKMDSIVALTQYGYRHRTDRPPRCSTPLDARHFGTLDLMTRGRAQWNVIARIERAKLNMGSVPEPDLCYYCYYRIELCEKGVMTG